MASTSSPTRALVFDSGVGALSIGAEIRQRLPGIELIHALDSGGFPYGEWQEEALTQHICSAASALVRHYSPDLMVLACNSASTAVLPALRASLAIPVVGVVPAIKPAAAHSRSRVIGLLATPGTVARAYTRQLIDDFAANCCVIAVGDASLAPAVEDWFWEGREAPAVYATIGQRFAEHLRFPEMDTVVLACTHFPLVAQQLAEQLGDVALIDSGEAIARRVEQLLGPALHNAAKPSHQAVILGERSVSSTLRQRLRERGIERLERFSGC